MQKLVFNLQMERNNEIKDLEPFTDTHFDNIKPAIFAHIAYLSGLENNSTMFNGELYKQFPYDTCRIAKTCSTGEIYNTSIPGQWLHLFHSSKFFL